MEGKMSSLIFDYHIPAYGNKHTVKAAQDCSMAIHP